VTTRLQIVRKVPKEQNTSVEVVDGKTIDLKMRVFVVNSEDAKAVGDYMSKHIDQVPAPFVLLAKQLPMAVLYDPSSLDVNDAAVADRLRKQAKTRAVRLLRESIGDKSVGVSREMLRGHYGALQPAEMLYDTLMSRTTALEGQPGRRFIIFAARNQGQNSAPASPKKRSLSASPREGSTSPRSPRNSISGGEWATGGGAGGSGGESKGKGGGRRTGASSASHLHRDMLEKAFKRTRSSPPGTAPGNPHKPP
jgi:hypothetical protein